MRVARLRLGDLLPKGLYWRTLLIIAAPAAILQLIISIIFLNDHWEATSKRMSQGVASDVALVIQLYEQNPTAENFESIRKMAWAPLRLEISLDPGGVVEARRCRVNGPPIDRYLTESLETEIHRKAWYDSTCAGTQVKIRLPITGGVLEVRAFRDRVQARSGPLFVVWIFGATIFISIISIIFIRNQVRPIEKLADAMESFGRGEDKGIFKARGAREVRRATHAFFDMRQRIRRHIDQRARLLAGVSHDLRTPLTRLRLQFALMAPGPELEDAKRDLAEMEATLEEYLTFAQGQFAEAPAQIDLGALAANAVADAARGGADITLRREGDLSFPARARAIRRALDNLIDNAASHGDKVEVGVFRRGDQLHIHVDDNGPGIPEEFYEDAFRPFSRLDETRTRHARGVGLGLAIVRDVARSHGGEVTLSRAPMGGLRATMRLPTPGVGAP